MSKLAIQHIDEIRPALTYAAGHETRGDVTSRWIQPQGYSLWACVSELADGAEILWDTDHPEEAIYVHSGALQVDGRTCPTDGALILESNVETAARARGPTQLVHFGPADPSPPSGGPYGSPEPQGHGLHVVGPGGWFTSGQREGTFARWYADSTCPTCRICLLQVERSSQRDGPIHHHSLDEIIYVVDGAVALGKEWYGPGTVLCIPALARYRIRTGEKGYRFLNYRRDVSEQVYERGSAPLLESALARGGARVCDLR